MLVFLFHYWTFFAPEISFFKAGHLGVDMFFVLSGFLVTLSLFWSQNFLEYFEKRLRRIVPLAFGIVGLVFLLKHQFSPENFLDLGVHLLFLQGFFPEFYHSLNPVLWSLSVEMLFYAMLPVLWIVLAKKNISSFFLVSGGLFLLSFFWRGYVFFMFPEASAFEKIFLSEQLWGRFDQFFLGMILAVMVVKKIVFSANIQKFFLLSGGALFGMSYYLFIELGSSFRDFFVGQVFLHFFVGLGFFLFLLWFIHAQTFFSEKIKKLFTPLLFLGEISYGIYVFHFPVLSVLHRVGMDPEISFFLALCSTLLLSWLSYEFFEKKFLKKKK